MGRSSGVPGEVRYKNIRIALKRGPDLGARAARSILIIGSGPSAIGLKPAMVADHSALLLNGAISLIGNQIAHPLGVVIEDERFVWRHFEMMRQKIALSTPCLFSVEVLRAIFEQDASWLENRTVILVDNIRKPYGRVRRTDRDLQIMPNVTLDADAGFSAMPDQGVFQGGSVVVSALQFALSLDVGQIGFIGIDLTNAKSPRFYERPGESAFSGIVGAEPRILAHMVLARDHATAKNIRLVNHSPVSALSKIGIHYQYLS